MTTSNLGLYIHIPFCVKKCRYCDFTSYPVSDIDTHVEYILKLIYEIRARRATLSENGGTLRVDTIYFGGGTPSFIDAEGITEILDAVYATYNVSEDAEITIEINPGTADEEKLKEYKSAGINRVSIGAQSFDAETLAFLGRIHGAEDIVRCVGAAREAGFEDLNLDLIFGVPGQSPETWERDLKAALAMSPEHVSFYGLQIEEGTPLHKDFKNGEFEAVDETEDRRMYHFAKDFLAKNGLYQYEISNSAKPGFESRHNLKYWSMEPYIGFGVGAHSYYNGRRFSNKPDLTSYLSAESEKEMTDWAHDNTTSDNMSEFIFLGLRRTAGIELSRFQTEFGKDFWELYGEETKQLIKRGLLEHNGDALRLTSLGLDLANTVFSEYV